MVQPAARERGWRKATVTVVVSCLSLAAVWWSTQGSLAALGPSDGLPACPAIAPPPPGCYPAWHVQVAALLSLVLLAVLAGAVLVIRRYGRVGPVTAIAGVVGLAAWLLARFPTHFLPIW